MSSHRRKHRRDARPFHSVPLASRASRYRPVSLQAFDGSTFRTARRSTNGGPAHAVLSSQRPLLCALLVSLHDVESRLLSAPACRRSCNVIALGCNRGACLASPCRAGHPFFREWCGITNTATGNFRFFVTLAHSGLSLSADRPGVSIGLYAKVYRGVPSGQRLAVGILAKVCACCCPVTLQ